MSDLFEYVHTEGNEPRFNMPYTPAIKVTGGRVVYLAGVTAAPVYHSHPHIASEFDDIPLDPEEQTEMCMGNLQMVVGAAAGASTPSWRSPATWSTRPATRRREPGHGLHLRRSPPRQHVGRGGPPGHRPPAHPGTESGGGGARIGRSPNLSVRSDTTAP